MKSSKNINIWIVVVLVGIFLLLAISAPFWLDQVEYAPSWAHYNSPNDCKRLTEYVSWLPVIGKIDCITTRSFHHRMFNDAVGEIDRKKLTELMKMFPDAPEKKLISDQIHYWQKLKDKVHGDFPLPNNSHPVSGLYFHTKQIDKLLSSAEVAIIFDGQTAWLHISSNH